MRALAAAAWAALVLAAGVHVAWLSTDGLRLGSDLLALLPQEDRDPARRAAAEAVTASINRRFVLLIGHPDRAAARAAAARIAAGLKDAGVADPEPGASGDLAAEAGRLYFPHRAGLLSPSDRQRLRDGRGREIADRALGQIFGPAGAGGAALLRSDPFLLLPAFLTALPLPHSRFRPDDGMLTARDGGVWWVLLAWRLRGEAYALARQNTLVAALDDGYARARRDHPDLTMLRTGAVFFAHAGARSALGEMTRIGMVSVLGIVVMILAVFRSAGPLWQSLLAIAVGILCALSVCLAAFRDLHVVALLFGSSLIGMTVDYSLHYCCEAFAADTEPRRRLRHVLPGMTLGVATTLIGYLALLLAPFPGLRQIAVFSAVGVGASFATVVLWFPLLDRRGYSPAGARWVRLTQAVWSLRDTKRFRAVVGLLFGLLAVAAALGAGRIEAVDDIRRMQSPPPDLLRQQAEIRRLTGIATATGYFLVRAPDAETALRREETLASRLDGLRAAGVVTGYRGPAGFVPSAARQRDNARLVRDRLESRYLGLHLDRLGLSADAVRPGNEGKALTPDEAARAIPILRDLVVASDGSGVSHVVLLDNPTDAGRLRAAADGVDGVGFIDPAGDYSRLLRSYRQAAMMLIAVSVVLMIGALSLRYGLRGSLRVMAPPAAAVALTPGLLALAGRGFSFFDAMALVLVLAIGVDYTVFCAEASGARRAVTLVAVTLAAISTLLSFGLLAFSDTAAVQAFGATMLCGIALAFVFSPFAAGVRDRAADVS